MSFPGWLVLPLQASPMDAPPSTPDARMMLIAIAISLAMVGAIALMRLWNRRKPVRSYVAEAMIGGPEIFQLAAEDRQAAIRELAEHAARILRWPDEATILKGLLDREQQMPTGLKHGFAIPHARFPRMGRSLVLFARSRKGIDWECYDDLPAHFIFLLLTPEENEDAQLKMLAELSKLAYNPESRAAIAEALDCRDVTRAIYHALKNR